MKKILTFLLILTLSGCDCFFSASGVVIDQETNEPIQNVSIGKTKNRDGSNPFDGKTMTDEDGSFELGEITGICNEMTFYISKEGYQTARFTLLRNSNDTIYMSPVNGVR